MMRPSALTIQSRANIAVAGWTQWPKGARSEFQGHDQPRAHRRANALFRNATAARPNSRLWPTWAAEAESLAGGHMHYSRNDSRKALREDARQLIEGP